MSNRSPILSILVLIVYGTLALVAVPLHHHAAEYVDTPQLHPVSIFHSVECGVCTFSSNAGIGEEPVPVGSPLESISEPFSTVVAPAFAVVSTTEYPRRGPPSFLL